MIKLTVTHQNPDQAELGIEGTLAGAAVLLLEEEVIRLLQQSLSLVLELNGVQFIDHAGVALLKSWAGERLVLRGGSAYVRALLEHHGLA
jgi:ABC-type transporter Mla MlaB component